MTKPTTRQLGGKKGAEKNLAKDPDFYRKIGQKGGKAPHTVRGFQLMTLEQIRAAGRKGGQVTGRSTKKAGKPESL